MTSIKKTFESLGNRLSELEYLFGLNDTNVGEKNHITLDLDL